MSAPAPAVQLIGRGPVALACALFLLRRGVPAAQIALELAPPSAPPPPELDRRVLALSEGSRQLLARLITLPSAGRIKHIDVSLRGYAGRTRIRAQDMQLPALGHVLPYRALLDSLQQAARTLAWAPVAENPTAATVCIHADGAPDAEADTRDFQQAALLAEVQSTRATASDWAYERFTRGGPLALLPLPTPGRWSLVWCDHPERCAERAAAPAAAFEADLAAHCAPRLGPLTLVSPPQTVPLQRRARRRLVANHAVWIGNAAQALHPVAGQGLNLGLRDAFELADTLALAYRQGHPLAATLPNWHRRRAPDRWLTLRLTDLMASSFTLPGAARLQSPLLTTLDLLPGLRRPLARQLAFGWR